MPDQTRITETLNCRLFKAPNFEKFVEENADLLTYPRLCDYLDELRRDSGLSVGQISQQSNIDRTYLHQILNGTRNPSRDKLLQLAFGLGLDEERTQEMLKAAQKSPLYSRIMRDAAILKCLHDHKHIDEVQALLSRMGMTLLGREDKNG